jgi:hypothetical protein
MATNDLLEAEARERTRVAIAAVAAALLMLAAAVTGILAQQDAPDNLPGALLYRNDHSTGVLLSAVCSGLSSLALAYVLDFLLRATRARSAGAIPSWVRPLPWIGGIGLAILVVAGQIVLVTKVSHFASEGTQTYREAKDLLEGGDYRTLTYLTIVPQLAFAFGLVMISLGAMRVGLLTRFLGYLGVISAALFVFALLPLPIVQIYWAGMIAIVLWPTFSGPREPPAWRTTEAVPWPSAQELREQRVRAAEARRGGDDRALEAGDDDAPAGDDDEQVGAPQRRKRKKRR